MNPGNSEDERGPAPKKRWRPLDSPEKDKGTPPGEVGRIALETLQAHADMQMIWSGN